MTLTATPSHAPASTLASPSAPPSGSAPASASSNKRVLGRFVTSPLVAAITIISLFGLAAAGTAVAAGSIPMIGTHRTTIGSLRVTRDDAPHGADTAELLAARGAPMRWSPAESRAVNERAAGQNFDRSDYKAAMKAAQYNQKNGWTDDGSERLGPGTPLRNNQKREGGSSGPCLDTFLFTAAICGEGDEDIIGGEGEGGVEVGGVNVEELGYVSGSSWSSSRAGEPGLTIRIVT